MRLPSALVGAPPRGLWFQSLGRHRIQFLYKAELQQKNEMKLAGWIG